LLDHDQNGRSLAVMTADAKPFGVSLMIPAPGFARTASIRSRQDLSSAGLSRTHAEVSPTPPADVAKRGDVDVVMRICSRRAMPP
jgi:hypothetical protein